MAPKPKRKELQWVDTYDSKQEKFPEAPSSPDVGWKYAFYIHLVAIFILGLVFTIAQNPLKTSGTSQSYFSDSQIGALYGGIVLLCVVAALIAWFWLTCMQRYAKQLITLCLLLTPAILFLMIIIIWVAIPSTDDGLIMKITFSAFLGLGIAVSLIVYCCYRHRIPFAAALLTTVSGLTKKYPGTSGFAFIAIAVEVVFMILWFFALIQVVDFLPAQNEQNAEGINTLARIVMYLFLFSAYWTYAVIKYTVHVTVCGVFGTWYFVGESSVGKDPTRAAAKRALGPSFGPICFGAFLIALVRLLRNAARQALRESDSVAALIIACIVLCIISCIEAMLEYFNRYAYVQVAVYGKSFIQAAKDTWNLVMTHGIYALINDNLVGNVLALGQFIGGVVCGIVGILFAIATGFDKDPLMGIYFLLILGLGGFFIGSFIVDVIMDVVNSGIACIFVCFAMEPERLRDNDPELYKVFYDAHGNSIKF